MESLYLSDIFIFVASTPSSRNIREGQEVLNAGHIVLCGTSVKSNDKIELYFLCLQNSALTTDDSHEITGTLLMNSDDKITISNMAYTCVAGSGHTCKHIVAVLLHSSQWVSSSYLTNLFSFFKHNTKLIFIAG